MVVHDEIDLAAGKLKVKTGGGDAGQNGLRSITATLGPDYRRVRLGIGHPGEKDQVTGHVLQNFSKDDIDWLKPLVEAMVEAAPLLAKDDDAGFMSKVALLLKPPKTDKPERSRKEERRVMGFKCGIVGLPNVGKSTLFNALTQTAAAQAANYPFCTIEPNVGDVAVPDPRLETLAKIAGSAEIIPTRITFVDIAGLVRGASKGEGLGNQFLANIREVDAVVHVLRCFEDDDITHVEGKIDPIADAETVETELMLADLDSLEKRIRPLEKKAKGGEKEAKEALALMMKGRDPAARRQAGAPGRTDAGRARALQPAWPDDRQAGALCAAMSRRPPPPTAMPFPPSAEAMAKKQGASSVVISAKIEEEIAQMPAEDRADFLESLGLEEPGLNRLIRAGYELLGLLTFFTVGPKEARAWTVTKGSRAPQAAGVIHTDFEQGFIRAETIAYADYVAGNGEAGAREAGKFRLEGKEYVVADGDVMHFRFNN